MIRQPQVLAAGDPLSRAVELTPSTAQADFPVVDGSERVVGLPTLDDLLRGLLTAAGVGEVFRLLAARPQLALGDASGQPHVSE